MFGYINVNKDELSKEEKAIYQAYYCGLCRRLKNLCGVKGQLILSYDMTFLLLLWTGLYGLEKTEESFMCSLHPGRKRLAYFNQYSDLAAELCVVLSYHSLLDDYEDDKKKSKLNLANYLKPTYDSIKEKYPDKVEAIERFMRETKIAQNENEQNIDVVAGLTGNMLKTLVAWDDDVWKNDLEDLGFYLGKFIYFMDAYEDLPSDIKKDSYNPLKTKQEELKDGYETYARSMLTSFMAESAKSFERLPIQENKTILSNILYSGVWTKYDYLRLKAVRKEKTKKSEQRKRLKRERALEDKILRLAQKKEERLRKQAQKQKERILKKAKKIAKKAKR